ncbi:MAG: PCRF domain-containing protein, partial [Chlamydiae bacterium]|nr:PCRF domain-containing protein [Chlamydiota bacterium]
MEKKVLELLSRLSEVEEELAAPELMQNRQRYLELTAEHKHLTELKEAWDSLVKARKDLEGNRILLRTEQDSEFVQMLEEEGASLNEKISRLEKEIDTLIVPPNPNDHRNTIVELRAGTGGDEAAIFVGDCVRMYLNYAAKKGWATEALSSTPSEMGGYKEYQFVVSGPNVHRLMQYEAGIHRVQRVPKTEAQGRLHTSA